MNRSEIKTMHKVLAKPIFFISFGILITSVTLGVVRSTEAQSSIDVQPPDKTVSLEKALRTRGWSIPGPSGYASEKLASVGLDGIQVEKWLMVSSSEVITYESFHLTNDVATIVAQECRLGSRISYEVQGKRFAIQAVLNPVRVDQPGQVEGLGYLISVFFLDEDGDGLFETRIQSFNVPKVPVWIRNLNR